MSEEKLFNGNLVIDIPDTFKQSENAITLPDTVKQYYLFINEENKSTMSFMLNNNTLNKDDVGSELKKSFKIISRMAPGFQQGEAKLKKTDNYNLGLLTYKSNAIDRDMFNVFTVMNLTGSELTMNFSCDMNDAIDFFQMVRKLINSISATESETAK